ncbi:MAG: PhzF family phenazine biosynthesis protein [Planctomycetota bacterium]
MKTYIVDSFTAEPFRGNPAGVCLCETIPPESRMLNIAAELGLSETAFVVRRDDGRYGIRYYSPKMEIPLCGHATLASAKVLFDRDPGVDAIHFVTGTDVHLETRLDGDRVAMKFPAYSLQDAEVPPAMLEALGLTAVVDTKYNSETDILMLVVDSSATLVDLKPDFELLVKSHDAIAGVLVTAAMDGEYDICSRFFWPWSGTQEDPVTGATHTFMAPYWLQRLGKAKLKSFQASERTGCVNVTVIDQGTVEIAGHACIVLEGELRV